jgi:hypothetical protein
MMRILFRSALKETRAVIKKAVRMVSATALVVLAACAMPGCYTRTVEAKGLGADSYDVSDPYQENSALDDWIFGERQDTRNRSLLNR